MYVIQRERQELMVDWMACTDMGGGGLHLTFSLLVVCTVNNNGKFECRGHNNLHFLHHADP